jgi:anti-sigma factor RsiW
MTDDSEPGMTIRCAELVELVTDYLEGSIDEDTRAEIEAHLTLCEGCTEYLRQMRETIRELGYVPVDTLGDRAKSDLMAAFRDFHMNTPR